MIDTFQNIVGQRIHQFFIIESANEDLKCCCDLIILLIELMIRSKLPNTHCQAGRNISVYPLLVMLFTSFTV